MCINVDGDGGVRIIHAPHDDPGKYQAYMQLGALIHNLITLPAVKASALMQTVHTASKAIQKSGMSA